MGASGGARRPRVVATVLVLLIVPCLVVGFFVGGRLLLADPAFGDTRPRGDVVGEGRFSGSRMLPARLGEDTLRWEAGDGGAVEVVVDRAERVVTSGDDFVREWGGVPDCQGMFLVQLTVSVEGRDSWRPDEQLTVQRMASPFGVQTADEGLEVLAEPLLSPEIVLSDGRSATGTVLFRGATDTDWSGNLVISTDEGQPLHVRSTAPPPLAGGCGGS